jgi:pentose-5-phosphate-3-epimerase
LEVDGGMSPETLPDMRAAGATAFVSATSIFKHPDGITAGIASLREAG